MRSAWPTAAYLLLLGIYILSKAFRQLRLRTQAPRHVGKLALFGGFIDAAGGGGWGPVVIVLSLFNLYRALFS